MGSFIDLTGQRFGRLTVIKRDDSVDSKKGAYWICECDCGNIKSIKSYSLRSGATQSCGCYNKEIISGQKEISDMIGKKFGRLTVIERAGNHITAGGQHKVAWKCQCECGNITIVTSQDLKSGHTKSCGCMPTVTKGQGLIDLTGQKFGELTVLKRAEDYSYIRRSDNKVINTPRWLCKCECGNEIIISGNYLRNRTSTKCNCDNRYSKSETIIADFLTSHNIKYKREYIFEDLISEKGYHLRFDFGILDNDDNCIMAVEYQGRQHYSKSNLFGIYQREYSDEKKRDYCKENNIPLYEIKYNENINEALNNLLNEICKY